MTRRYRTEAFAAIHETMEALHEVGAIDKQTMCEFDAACLTPVRMLSPDEIRTIRLREKNEVRPLETYPTRGDQ